MGFGEAMRAAGIEPPPDLVADGALHRFPTSEKRGDLAGFYILHGDGIPAGYFGCWRRGVAETWRADLGRELSGEEEAECRRRVAEARQLREEAERLRHADGATRALALWERARPASIRHPYLVRKAILAYGARELDGSLVIPLRDVAGTLRSLQSIAPDGSKLFLPGGRVRGAFYTVGRVDRCLYVAEGFATAVTIHEATGDGVAVAFCASNLEPVAVALRARHLGAVLVVCADDDTAAPVNVGLLDACKAARAACGLVAEPGFGMARAVWARGATDFNDLARLYGIDRVLSALAQAVPAW